MKSDVLRLFGKLALLAAPFLFVVLLNIDNAQLYSLSAQQAALNDKVQRLLVATSTRPDVIIAGESRAEKALVPAVFKGESGLDTVNIAVPDGTLGQMYDELNESGQLNQHRLIIISVSSYEINDSILFATPIYRSIVYEEPLGLQKLEDAVTYYGIALQFYLGNIKDIFRSNITDTTRMTPAVLAADGYNANIGPGLMTPATVVPDTDDPWYTDVRVGGIQQQDFLRAIDGFGHTDDTVVIYLGPIAPEWRASLVGTDGPAVEAHFIQVIEDAIAPYPNMHFIDFRASDIPTLTNAEFGDDMHLNANGAPIFTDLLVSTLRSDGILKKK